MRFKQKKRNSFPGLSWNIKEEINKARGTIILHHPSVRFFEMMKMELNICVPEIIVVAIFDSKNDALIYKKKLESKKHSGVMIIVCDFPDFVPFKRRTIYAVSIGIKLLYLKENFRALRKIAGLLKYDGYLLLITEKSNLMGSWLKSTLFYSWQRTSDVLISSLLLRSGFNRIEKMKGLIIARKESL